ncbi:MAG: hypothetical protein GY716_20170 [bacterium]|nr:hypothetical protein [bacterium]
MSRLLLGASIAAAVAALAFSTTSCCGHCSRSVAFQYSPRAAAAAGHVLSVVPANNALDVSPGARVTVEFTHPVVGWTVTESSFSLSSGGAPVAGALSISPDHLRVTFDPGVPLDSATVHRLTLTRDIVTAAGPLTPFQSLFRTGERRAVEVPLDDSTVATPPKGSTQARSGTSVSGAGDLDGDGIDDFMAGAPGFDPGSPSRPHSGAALVFLGDRGRSERESPDIMFVGANAGERAGVSVAGGADLNGDGTPDLVIGADQSEAISTPAAGPGLVYVIYFDPADYDLADPAVDVVSLDRVDNGMADEIAGVVYHGHEIGDRAGFSVAVGRGAPGPTGPELLVGAPGRDARAGAVYLLFDPSPALTNDLASAAGLLVEGSSAGDALGYSVAFVGDVTGDPSTGDYAFAAPFADTPAIDAGRVYILDGGTSETGTMSVTAADVAIHAETAGTHLGWDVAGGGDALRDSVPDLLLGAPECVGLNGGAGCVWHLSTTLLPGTHSVGDLAAARGVVWHGAFTKDRFGIAVAHLGDVNGDGFDDVGIGASGFDTADGISNAGATYRIDGFDFLHAAVFDVHVVGSTLPGSLQVGVEANEGAGTSVSAAGDVDDDELPDYAVGAPNNGVDNAGVTYVVTDSTGVCDSTGCERIDILTGGKLVVPPGALTSPTEGFDVTGLIELSPTGRAAAELQKLTCIGSGSYLPTPFQFEPDLPLPTIFVPIATEFDAQVSFGESFPVHEFDAPQWKVVGTGVVVHNPWPEQMASRRAVRIEIEQFHAYALFVADADLDGWSDPLDCNDDDETINPGAVEFNDDEDDNCNTVKDENTGPAVIEAQGTMYDWEDQPLATMYDVAVSTTAQFIDGTCTITRLPEGISAHDDPIQPLPGTQRYYLNRPVEPHLGSWGLEEDDDDSPEDSDERNPTCPQF